MSERKEYTVTFNVHLEPTEPYNLEEGTMIYDGYTVTGMRIHVVKEDMDAPIIWNNALIISEGMLAQGSTMSKLIDQYQTLRNTIIERAIHINNMLYDLELPDELEGYHPSYCGVQVEYLRNSVINEYIVNLIYPDPYDDYEETWDIPSSYIDMTDEDICEDFVKRYTEQSNRNKQHKIDLLKREAEYLGYDLVEKKL